jgi:hypothetical protein
VSPVKYEQGFYIPEDGIRHSDRRENLKFYINSKRIWRNGELKSDLPVRKSVQSHVVGDRMGGKASDRTVWEVHNKVVSLYSAG